MKQSLKPGQWELISTALDGKLNPKERAQFDLALQSDQALETGLEEMAALRAFLRSVPRRKAPRSFALRPDQAISSKSSGSPIFFKMVSVAAVVLMISLYAIEFLPGLLSPKLSSAPAAADSVMDESMRDLAPTYEPLILWNRVAGAEKAYGMGGGSEQPSLSIYPPIIDTTFPEGLSAEPAGIEAGFPAEEVVEEMPEVEAAAEELAFEEELAAESLPEQSEPETEDDAKESSEPVANPIIGIRPAEDWGQEIETQGSAEFVQGEPARNVFPWLLAGEIGLGVLAISAAMLAFLSQRRR